MSAFGFDGYARSILPPVGSTGFMYPQNLAAWRANTAAAGLCIIDWGNSHVSHNAGRRGRWDLHTGLGEGLAGACVRSYGVNGARASVLLADTAAGYGLGGVIRASNQILFTVNPTASSTITLNGTVVTFVASGATGNQVNIGATLAITLASLETFLNASSDTQITKNSYSVPKNGAAAPDTLSRYILDMWAKLTGTAGAGFTVATTVTGATVGMAATRCADLIVLPDLANDIRDGAYVTTVAQGVALYLSIIDAVRAYLPNVPMVVPTFFALLTVDGGPAYVVPNSSAQAYSTLDRMIVASVMGLRPGVVMHDQQLIGGATSTATSAFMSDQLHENGAGAYASIDALVRDKIGFEAPTRVSGTGALVPPLSLEMCDRAIAENPTAPWAVYPRVLEDSRYFTRITGGVGSTISTDRFQFVTDDPAGLVHAGDILQIANRTAIVIPASVGPSNQTASGSNQVRLDSMTGLVGAFTTPTSCAVYRPKYGDGSYGYDANLHRYMDDPAYAYAREVAIVVGGTNFFRVKDMIFLDNDIYTLNVSTSDVIIMPGLAAITLTAAPTTQTTAALQFAITGDFSGFNAKYRAWIFGTSKANRVKEKAPSPVRSHFAGALSAGTLKHSKLTRGATYRSSQRNLGTASSDGTVTHSLLVNGTEVVKTVWAQGATGAGTVTYNNAGNATVCTSTSFGLRPGDVLTETIAFSGAGTGAADLDVTHDI